MLKLTNVSKFFYLAIAIVIGVFVSLALICFNLKIQKSFKVPVTYNHHQKSLDISPNDIDKIRQNQDISYFFRDHYYFSPIEKIERDFNKNIFHLYLVKWDLSLIDGVILEINIIYDHYSLLDVFFKV